MLIFVVLPIMSVYKLPHGQFAYSGHVINTEMHWRALQAVHIYVRQHHHEGQLSVEELRAMVGHEGEAFPNHVLHYTISLHGTRQYWFKQ